jgi:pSer/pThr/pTyr-binding forkhead associated (FHA) protein
MSLAIKAVTGPLKDQIFPLKEGLTVGRQGAGISLNDPKVSSLHARVIQDQAGGYSLEDNNSKNGLRVDGEKVTSIALNPGAKFMIGDSEFEVISGEAAAAPAQPKPAKKQRYWYDVLADYLGKYAGDFTDKPKPLVDPGTRFGPGFCAWGAGQLKMGARLRAA